MFRAVNFMLNETSRLNRMADTDNYQMEIQLEK